MIQLIKTVFQGVVYLVSRFVKVIALILIGAMAISLLSVLIGTHFGLPYLGLIAPDPWITGYVGYYTGLISFVIIPFVLLILLASKLIWKHRRIHTYRYPMAGIWIVTTVIFLGTALFTARNFSYGTSVSKQISEAHIGDDKNVHIDISRLSDHGDMKLRFDDAFLSRGKLFNRDGVNLMFAPSDEDIMTVTQTVYSRGTNYRTAVGNMAAPDHRIEVEDNNISLDEYYIIQKNRKFRGQRFDYEVALPIGTVVSFNRSSEILPKRKLRSGNYDNTQMWVMTDEGLEIQDTTVI